MQADERAGSEPPLWPLDRSLHPLRSISLGHGAFTELKVRLGWWDLSREILQELASGLGNSLHWEVLEMG